MNPWNCTVAAILRVAATTRLPRAIAEGIQEQEHTRDEERLKSNCKDIDAGLVGKEHLSREVRHCIATTTLRGPGKASRRKDFFH